MLLPAANAEDSYRYSLTICNTLGTVDGIPNCAIRQDKLFADGMYQDEKCLGTTDIMLIAPS